MGERIRALADLIQSINWLAWFCEFWPSFHPAQRGHFSSMCWAQKHRRIHIRDSLLVVRC